MTDSIRVVDRDAYHRVHGTHAGGTLHKGHSITAATASIPSKYQTIVIDGSERKGFSSRAKRFNDEAYENVNPGPGNYMGTVTFENKSPSYSKKGTGGFASRDRRLHKHESTCGPGSGAYNLPSMLQGRKDYNKATTTGAFSKPIAQKQEEGTGKKALPAPNLYNVANVKTGRVNNVTADAAFKSRTRRELINNVENAFKPAPWHYNVNDVLTRNSVKVPLSSFKSKTERNMQQNISFNPGPGTYNPDEPVEPTPKTILPRKHYLCISAPAMPLPMNPANPGPGSYELVNYEGPLKHFMSSSAFVSSTTRWSGGPIAPTLPGPAHYRPLENGKQSFIYNAASRWI